MRFFGLHHTRPSLPRPRVLQAVLVVLALLLALAPNAAAAKPRTWPVQGTFQTQVLPLSACPPASLACARGIVTGDLAGTVAVVIDQSQFVVDATGVPFSRYSGTITIETVRGDLHGRVDGQVRLTDGQLNSVVVFNEGTRGFHHTSGSLSVSGMINLATGAEYDTYSGALVR